MRPSLWNDGQVTNLGTFGGNESFAIGVNNHGQMVGAAANTIADPLSVFFGWGTQTRGISMGERLDAGSRHIRGPRRFRDHN